MSIVTGQTKFIGSAASAVAYYSEASDDPVLAKVRSYYGTPKDGVVFSNVAGKATAQLVGLDLSLGLTREQHAQLHNGRWGDRQLTRGNYAPVWETDERGRPIKAPNPVTGKLEKVPVMEPAFDEAGEPILDPLTGEQALKMKTESATVAGFDVTFALDKSWGEFIIAHPEHTDLVRENFLKAVNTAMTWTEDNAQLIVTKTGGVKQTHEVEGLVWWTVFGTAARPTPESESYGADVHLHAHSFLSASAYFRDGEWRKIDSQQLFATAELRGQVCSLTMNKLMEDAGLNIDYAIDRKGRYYSQIAESNERVRDFFSTNRNRLYDLTWKFEQEHGRKPTSIELINLKNMTRLQKTKAAKEADELGNLDQVELWRAALENAGHELTIADLLDSPVQRPEDAKAELFARLEAPGGVARDIESAAVFGPEAVMPALIRSAEGLGYGVDDLEQLAADYIANELVVMRPANDPQHRLYSTKTILRGEEVIADRLEVKAGQTFKEVPRHVVEIELRSLRYSPDPDQERAIWAACGPSGSTHVTGFPGSGKTTSGKVIVSAHRKAGYNEFLVITSARKRGVETAKAIGADKGWSVEALKYAASKGWKATEKSVVLIDEAAMLNTFEMSEVMELIGPAKLITLGDAKQAQAIGAGGWYETELANRGSVQLTRNYRQRDHRDVEAWNLLREGDGHGCVANLHERKRIHVAEHREDLVTEVQARYEHHLDRGLEPSQIGIVVTGSNSEVLDPANRMAQRVLIERGIVDELSAYTVVEQSTGRIWKLHAGDRVVFNSGYWFNSDYSTAPILNGTTGVIERLDNDGGSTRVRVNLDTEDRRKVTVVLSKEMNVQPIGVGYAQSTTKWQGGEVDVALCLPGNPGVADLNSSYSAFTRGRSATEVIIDADSFGQYPLQRLGESISNETPKEQASAYLAMWDEFEREVEDVDQADELVQRMEVIQQVEQAQGQSRDFGIGLN